MIKKMGIKLQKCEAKVIKIKNGYKLILPQGEIEDNCQEIKKSFIEVDLKKLFKDNDIFDLDIHNIKTSLEMKFFNPDKKLIEFLSSKTTIIIHSRYNLESRELESICLEEV